MSTENDFVVQILNYQRIKKAKLEFSPGLNVICGQTNNGKSSIIRALETAIYNISREGHVSLGETKSAVGLKYRGHEVIWRRDTDAASQVTYRVDGKIYGKLGRGQPEVVKEALGISEVEINETKFRVNFSKQMAYPFLLNATPSELFKFIVQSSEEDNVVEVLNDMRSDVNEIASNVKKYDEARNSLGTAFQREAAKFKEKKQYLPYCEEVLALESKVKSLKKLKETIESYEKCRYVVQKSEEAAARIQKIQQYIEQVEQKLSEMIAKSSKLSETISQYKAVKTSLSQIDVSLEENNKVMSSLSDVEKYIELLTNMEPNQMKLSVLKQKVDEYQLKKEILETSTSEIVAVTEDIKKKEKVFVAVGKAIDRTDSRKEELGRLKEQITKYADFSFHYRQHSKDEEECRTILSDVESEISSIGVCPYCGSEMKGGTHEHS